MIDDIRKELANFVFRSVDYRGRPATVGRQDGTIYPTSEGGTEYKDRLWVTYTDTGTTLTEAIVDRNGVNPVPEMPVLIQDIRGIPTAVLVLNGHLMQTYTGNGTSYPAPSHNHYLEGPNPEYVEGLRFMPVGVHPSEPAALTVYIEPGFYRYEGVINAWTGGDSGSLAAYVPVVDDARIHFVIIALDRSDNSIDIIDGDDVLAVVDPYFTVPAFVDYDDILAIDIDAKYMPLAVVELVYGQAAVKVKHITYDHRLWGGEAGIDINGLTEDTAPDPEADYWITYDASAGVNRKVLPENMPGIKGGVTLLFSQTVDKAATNTTTPTDLFSMGVGSVTIPANTLEVGSTVRVYMAGHLYTTGTPDFELSLEFGGAELASTGVNALASGLVAVGWRLWFDFTCRSGPAFGYMAASGVWRLGESMYGLVKTTVTFVDPADPNQIEVLATWGTADPSNAITCQVATVELLPIIGL